MNSQIAYNDIILTLSYLFEADHDAEISFVMDYLEEFSNFSGFLRRLRMFKQPSMRNLRGLDVLLYFSKAGKRFKDILHFGLGCLIDTNGTCLECVRRLVLLCHYLPDVMTIDARYTAIISPYFTENPEAARIPYFSEDVKAALKRWNVFADEITLAFDVRRFQGLFLAAFLFEYRRFCGEWSLLLHASLIMFLKSEESVASFKAQHKIYVTTDDKVLTQQMISVIKNLLDTLIHVNGLTRFQLSSNNVDVEGIVDSIWTAHNFDEIMVERFHRTLLVAVKMMIHSFANFFKHLDTWTTGFINMFPCQKRAVIRIFTHPMYEEICENIADFNDALEVFYRSYFFMAC